MRCCVVEERLVLYNLSHVHYDVDYKIEGGLKTSPSYPRSLPHASGI